MTASPTQPSLLEELDTRQNEVLQQLDELNRRVEDLLRAHGARLVASTSASAEVGNEAAAGDQASTTDRAA